MPHLIANGIRIHYAEHGDGPVMIWLHGLFGTVHAWDEVFDRFPDRYRVIAYDARGHGLSEIPDGQEKYSQDLMVADLLDVMDTLGIDRAIVVGHSMGGNVALNFALQHQERCLGVIPVATGSGSSHPEWWRASTLAMAGLAEREGMAALPGEMAKIEPWAPSFSHPRVGPRISAEVAANSVRGVTSTIRGVQTRRPGIFELEPSLLALHVPALIVAGGADWPVTECSAFMTEKIPDAELVSFDGCGHWVHLEALDSFLDAVDRFAARVSGTAV